MSNYLQAIFEQIASGELEFKRGAMTQVVVLHDKWCRHWQEQACNCNPEIRTGSAG